jgi:hypothetical protein
MSFEKETNLLLFDAPAKLTEYEKSFWVRILAFNCTSRPEFFIVPTLAKVVVNTNGGTGTL